MSQAEAGVLTVVPQLPQRRTQTTVGFLALFRSELTLTFRRARTIALLGILAALPVLIGVVVKVETGGPGEGPAFIAQVSQNGLFLVFTALAVALPVFLPMTVGVVAGDSIAGEASTGTLRYLLVAPAGRTRLLAAKFTAALAFCLAATLAVALTALLTGAALFPLGQVTLLSGDTIGLAAALLRALLVAGVVAASLAGLVAIGLFVSTLTGSGIAAMATTVGLVLLVQILDTFPQLHAIQPFLFTHQWLSFSDLLRQPMHWDNVLQNLGLQALYVAVFGSAAWARFTSRDITA
ncbi:ABC transporter permease [Kitasatospora sp. MAP5-34]|uniref:ABC transporter permease n=1 Tax=Kitasatospora sp. MAP5-34 TaxID=3035102 RepID=UPI002475BD84|nr:ABC transporter permease [Kitasatospora sp. MAP5-34]MDH6577678.1 ABC-2 type transport system permease protein [Kitasatospora sp. MAP5-34]